MVKATGPCFSLDAHGTLANAITYQKLPTTRIVRRKPKPLYTRTTGQNTVRNTHAKATEKWHELLAIQQDLWKAYTDGNGNSGYQAWMSQWVHRTLENLFQYKVPPNHGYCLVGEYKVGELITGGVFQDP